MEQKAGKLIVCPNCDEELATLVEKAPASFICSLCDGQIYVDESDDENIFDVTGVEEEFDDEDDEDDEEDDEDDEEDEEEDDDDDDEFDADEDDDLVDDIIDEEKGA